MKFQTAAISFIELQDDGHQIDLIISDVVMPHLGGPALLARLSAGSAAVPGFIFVTGHAPQAYLIHGELDPSVPLITKPWSNEELLAQIRRVLDHQSQAQAKSAVKENLSA